MTEQTETRTVNFPKRRVRINHKWTAKDGWRLDETCVEIECGPAMGDDAIREELRALAALAFVAGETEATRRNAKADAE